MRGNVGAFRFGWNTVVILFSFACGPPLICFVEVLPTGDKCFLIVGKSQWVVFGMGKCPHKWIVVFWLVLGLRGDGRQDNMHASKIFVGKSIGAGAILWGGRKYGFGWG